jgi:hypothetical protein
LVTSAEGAEELTGTFLKNKFHEKVSKIRFSQVKLENGIWQIKAELDLKVGLLRRVRHYLSLTVDSITRDVLSYEESPAQRIPRTAY